MFHPAFLFWPNTTPVMIKHAVVLDCAFQAFDIELRVLLEQFSAIRATAKVHHLSTDVERNGPSHRLLGQAGRADNQVTRFLKILPGIGSEKLTASLTAEAKLFTVMMMTG